MSLRHTLSGKLIALLLGAMFLVFGTLGILNIRLHKRDLEQNTRASAENISDVIKRSTSYHMLRNDREALYNIIKTIGTEPGIVRLRIIDRDGRISYSSEANETNTYVDKSAESCYACHARSQPLSHLDRRDRSRIFRAADGGRVIGVINPIENQPSCWNAACHYHTADQKILGVLDVNMSLVRADAAIANGVWYMVLYTLLAIVGISLLTYVFIMRFVHRPITALKDGTERLKAGELGCQINVDSRDEIGKLATSFNQMSLQLRDANEEITAWARTLEKRIEQKTLELTRAHEKMVQAEKMSTIGKMAAVVAHEVNNPLAGILTYAKLMKKWMDRRDLSDERIAEFSKCLDMIASESRRCGDLVKNLLMFSRTAPMNLTWTDLNQIVKRCTFLVKHKMEMTAIHLDLTLDPELPLVRCDAAQIEQVLLALIVNAIEAMPRGGNLWIRSRALPASGQVELQIRDDGTGIPPAMLAKLFEPFVTTKEESKGVGLGLAISRNIIDRHTGKIEVESELGRGTTFYIFLPQDTNSGETAEGARSSAAAASR